MANPVIQAKNVSITLGGSVQALQHVDVELVGNNIVGFIGPSGAGKTTLIRALVGRQRLTSGAITIFGQPAGSAALRPALRYMTQENSVYPDLTVVQNLKYFAVMTGVPRASVHGEIKRLLEQVDLAKQANQLVGSLSGGQKQRVSLAVSLIGDPKLLVLDEPTVGLDPVLREQIWKLLRKLAKEGKTVIITSHVMEEAERCDELLLLRDGKVIAHDTPTGLKQRTDTKSVEQSFLKLVGGSS